MTNGFFEHLLPVLIGSFAGFMLGLVAMWIKEASDNAKKVNAFRVRLGLFVLDLREALRETPNRANWVRIEPLLGFAEILYYKSSPKEAFQRVMEIHGQWSRGYFQPSNLKSNEEGAIRSELTEIYKQISVPAPTYGCDMFMPRKMWGHYYGASAPQHTDPRPVHGASDAAASDKIVAEHRMGANVVIHVIAIITAKPGMRGAILAAFQANMPVVRAEQGCIEYGPATDVEGVGPFQTEIGRDTFVVIEKWESAEALKARAASPHMDAYGAKTREMIASRVIYVLASA